jgi:hypothetical protein
MTTPYDLIGDIHGHSCIYVVTMGTNLLPSGSRHGWMTTGSILGEVQRAQTDMI